MSEAARRLSGLLGIGLSWGVVWAVLLVAAGLIIGVVDPASIDPGEGSLMTSGIGLMFGFLSGVSFAAILAFAENRKSIRDLSLARVTAWGILGSAALPLLTPMNDALIIVSCPLGALCAAASVVIGRKATVANAVRPNRLKWIARVCANPLQAVCAANG